MNLGLFNGYNLIVWIEAYRQQVEQLVQAKTFVDYRIWDSLVPGDHVHRKYGVCQVGAVHSVDNQLFLQNIDRLCSVCIYRLEAKGMKQLRPH